jgi:hypothetical protein
MEPNKVDAAQGWNWIKEGVLIFIKNPSVCLLFFLVSIIRWKVLISIPMFGNLVLILLTPSIVGILFLAYRIHLQGGKLDLKSFITAMRSFTAELLRVGFIYAAGLILSAALMQIVSGNSTAVMAILGDAKALSHIMSRGGVTPILFALALIPLIASFFLFFAAWFAPALIVFNGYKAKEAMKLGLKAAYINARAFALYFIILGGSWLAYLIAMYLLPGIILIPLNLSVYLLPAVNVLSTLFWPITAPIVLISVYTSYVNVFAINTENEDGDMESKANHFLKKLNTNLHSKNT